MTKTWSESYCKMMRNQNMLFRMIFYCIIMITKIVKQYDQIMYHKNVKIFFNIFLYYCYNEYIVNTWSQSYVILMELMSLGFRIMITKTKITTICYYKQTLVIIIFIWFLLLHTFAWTVTSWSIIWNYHEVCYC